MLVEGQQVTFEVQPGELAGAPGGVHGASWGARVQHACGGHLDVELVGMVDLDTAARCSGRCATVDGGGVGSVRERSGPAWMSTRSAVGRRGAAGSPWRCWRWRSWRSRTPVPPGLIPLTVDEFRRLFDALVFGTTAATEDI